ncbi:MAG: EAL domain-containing protein [Nitrosomonadales bacterium]|nr:EAL domain-containing protein [Nitrosomonadales bacterium]
MNDFDTPSKPPRVLSLVLIYAGAAALWIVLSDSIVAHWISSPEQLTKASILKGLLFVGLTSLLLYGLLRRAATRFRMAAEATRRTQDEKLHALRLLDAIAEGSSDAIFAKDAQGRYVMLNKAAELVVGKPALEVLGKTDTAIFPPENAALVMADDRRIMVENKVYTYEHTLSTAHGTRVFLTTQGPLQDADGKICGVFGIARDITERKEIENALRESEAAYRSLFENMLNSVVHARIIFDGERPIDMEYLSTNPAFAAVTGITEPVVGRRISEVIPGYCERNPESIEIFGHVASTGIPKRWEHYLAELGRWFSFMIYSPAQGEVIIVTENITERKKAEAQLRKLSLAVEQSPESIVITDLEANIEYVNQSFVNNTGYRPEEVLGKNPNILHSGKTPQATFDDLWRKLTAGQTWEGELHNQRRDGSQYTEQAIISPIRQADGRITHYVAVKQDITEKKRAEAEIHRLAFYDSLTHLPNRALLLFNLDRFKNLNDAGGPILGDEILKATGERLSHILREGDMVAHLSGDEFAILLPSLSLQANDAAHQALYISEKIQAKLREPFHLHEQTFVLTACLGVALFPEDAQDTAQNVLRRCDTALHFAKTRGSAQVTFFDESLEAVARQRFDIEQELRRAITGDELRIYLQPQVEANGQMVGAEALVRWQHPARGLLPPGTFIPIAEESDLIVGIGERVFTEICRMLVRPEIACCPIRISVNISPRHFRQPNFVEWVKQVLNASGADPARLTLEITEGMVIDNLSEAVARMTELIALGIHFSMDDFGTGYSSLAYLKRLPLHELKIDKTFVQDAPSAPNDAALVETILSVAHHLHLKVVAEGVETQEQADFLNARATVIHQGYLFGKPVPMEVWLDGLEQRFSQA